MPINDGGPAFPVTEYSNSNPYAFAHGASLRDYFAVNAPAEPQGWFEPRMPPKPEIDWGHEHPTASCCDREYGCSPVNWRDRNEWDREREKQTLIQWPWAWADAMLAERQNGGAA